MIDENVKSKVLIELGRIGGKARVNKLTSQEHSAHGRMMVNARWEKVRAERAAKANQFSNIVPTAKSEKLTKLTKCQDRE